MKNAEPMKKYVDLFTIHDESIRLAYIISIDRKQKVLNVLFY